MGPADEACSVEEVEEALQLISHLMSQCQDSGIHYMEASLLLALMEFTRKPGLATQPPGLAEKLTIPLTNLQTTSHWPVNPLASSLHIGLLATSLHLALYPCLLAFSLNPCLLASGMLASSLLASTVLPLSLP